MNPNRMAMALKCPPMQLSYPQSGTLSMSVVCRKNKNNDVSAGPHGTQLLLYVLQKNRLSGE